MTILGAMQYIFNKNIKIEFQENLGFFRPVFFYEEKKEFLPILIKDFQIKDAVEKMKLITVDNFSFDLARMTILGAIRIAISGTF